MIGERIKQAVRDVKDFPSAGIVFKDITPIFKDPVLCSSIVDSFIDKLGIKPDLIAGVESRGFLFGVLLANRLQVPFVPIRKAGKLPGNTVSQSYELEYGTAAIEVQEDAVETGQKVLIHDDLLATGGTVSAAAQLMQRLGASISGFNFLISLNFLNGKDMLTHYSCPIVTLAEY